MLLAQKTLPIPGQGTNMDIEADLHPPAPPSSPTQGIPDTPPPHFSLEDSQRFTSPSRHHIQFDLPSS